MRKRIDKKIIVSFILGIVFFLTPIATASATGAPGVIDSTVIDDYIATEMGHGKIKGLAISIVHGDEVLYQNCYGTAGSNRKVTAETPFGIGSVGKTFTALAIRQLITEGKLNENDAVADFIEDFNPTYEGETTRITIRQLLTHSSGFSQRQGGKPYLFNSNYSIEEVVDKLKAMELVRPAGSDYEYSNINYVILGRIIEIVTEQRYEDYIEENVFQTLDMSHSYFDEKQAKEDGLSDGYTILYGLPIKSHYTFPRGSASAGYVFCSIEDMAHYITSFLNRGYYNGASVVADNDLMEPVDPLENGFLNGWYDESWFVNYGYPKNELYLNSYGYNGAAPNYTSSIKINQELRYAVVVIDNTMDENNFLDTDIDSSTICNAVMEYLVLGKEPSSTDVKGNYSRLTWVFLAAIILIAYSMISVKSILRHKSAKVTVIHAADIILDFVIPITAILAIPLYNDSNWSWLLATWPEVNYLIIGAIYWLIILGIVKLMICAFDRRRLIKLINKRSTINN